MTGFITELPTAIGEAIGISGSAEQLYIGGLILTALIMFSAIITMNSVKKVSVPLMAVGLFSILGVLTVISWCPSWILVVGMIAIAAMFGGKVIDWIGR